MRTSFLLTGIISLIFAACILSQTGSDDSPQEGRIVMGKSIDSVEVGDSTGAVVRKLGQPSEIIYGDFAGFIYEYEQGKFAGLSILFADAFNSRAVSVSATAPYSGTTKEGVGIGTTKANLQRSLGLPDTNFVSANWPGFGGEFSGDIYLYDSLAFVFKHDTTDKVESIWMILLRF